MPRHCEDSEEGMRGGRLVLKAMITRIIMLAVGIGDQDGRDVMDGRDIGLVCA